MDSQGIVIVLLSYFIYTESSETECFNNKTGVNVIECCQDYRNVSGKCEVCIGSWGKECRNNCSYGHYGLGCRKKCNCSYRQTCDPKQGCIEPFEAPLNTTPNPDLDYFTTIEAYLLVVSVFLILFLLCTILICNRKMKKQSKPFQTYADEQEVIYDDIRGSRMVDNGDTSTRVCNLPPNLNGAITPVERYRMTKERSNQARIPLRRSRTLGPEGYGHWCRGSDNYNHINLKNVKPLSSYSNVMTSGYDVFNSPKTSPEAQINDNECEGNKQFKEEVLGNNHRSLVHPIRKNRSMVNRPYSSVKYNRKIRMNEEH